MQNTLDGIGLHQLFTSGYRNLKKNMEAINDLNVFPVPDGDTGANMVMTFGGGLQAVSETESHVGQYMQGLSRAVLLSARGNSGVIFSQFVHGLYRGFAEKETVTFADLAEAFACAKEDAYHSIIAPTEGTILTVIREAAEFLAENAEKYDSFQTGFDALQVQMSASLKRTPELLSVLKEAGVVDSGGAGLVCFVDGICAHLHGESPEEIPDHMDWSAAPAPIASNFGPDSRLEYGYCTEFILQLMNYKTDLAAFDLQKFTDPLEQMGDSIVAVHNDGIVKIHIHTFTPDMVLGYARRFGEFVSVKIENMSIQHSQVQTAVQKEKVKYAIIAVAAGEGIKEYFESIGASYVIDGGQTNNPPVSAFLEAFAKFDAEHIVVLPNNSNIVLAANQAADAYTECDVRVIPTKSITEGCSALSMMSPWYDTVDEMVEEMSQNLGNVTTGYVTTAVRDANMDGMTVKKGDCIGLDGKHLMASEANRVETAKALVEKIMAATPKDVIIFFYGEAVTEEEVQELSNFLQEAYPLVDVGFVSGKQSVYDFIISLE
ncbi:MAG: DAK2 domain-containing protein [Oscillospiraceae bacterium]|nr:DAK2 domain-containing protein [Oscillospiraceae bacterium]